MIKHRAVKAGWKKAGGNVIRPEDPGDIGVHGQWAPLWRHEGRGGLNDINPNRGAGVLANGF